MGKRTRKSTKKAWRKTDISSVEQQLDEIREQNRLWYVLSPDASLFNLILSDNFPTIINVCFNEHF